MFQVADIIHAIFADRNFIHIILDTLLQNIRAMLAQDMDLPAMDG